MHIRPRKFNNNQNDFETLQKQLNNDFEVHTYLQQHHLNLNNAQSYAQLINSLTLERRTRSKKLLKLKTVMALHPKTKDTFFRQEFQVIEDKTGKEEEIRKNLERQITETKKSLNLLKGDIGFLVSRNESSQLLGSKVTKVKIVAEDQLKRVSLAYSKDREELKIRNEMQKKFGKKIKNISNYESSSLRRSKEYYIENQIRKNEVYNKLYWSQQAAQKSEQIAEIQKQKQKIDSENRIQQLAFLQLTAVIKHFSLKHLAPQQHVCKFYAEIDDFLGKLDLSEVPEEKQMAEDVDNILKEYHSLKDNIKTTTQFYNQQLTIKQQLSIKMKECEHQQHELLQKFKFQALSGYIIAQGKLKDYNQKLKKFASTIKTFFVLLTYLKKYQKRYDSDIMDKKRNSSFFSQNNIKYSNYITQLHRTYQMLSSQQVSSLNPSQNYSAQYIDSLYENIGKDIYASIATLKKKIAEGFYYPVERSHYQKQTIYSQASQFSLPSEVIYNEYNQISEPKKIKVQKSEKKIEECLAKKAQRIQLLQDVDKDYYKMIKSTMKMEKENTRKNYQFQRVFKRAKYASRDDILEEKRFQASFSVLFTKQSMPTLTQTFGLQRRKSAENPLSKTMHCQTMSSFKPNKQIVQQFKKQTKPIVKRKLYEERQKKTRLNQKLREALCYSAF